VETVVTFPSFVSCPLVALSIKCLAIKKKKKKKPGGSKRRTFFFLYILNGGTLQYSVSEASRQENKWFHLATQRKSEKSLFVAFHSPFATNG
jgi:hypothetical protein